jgi:hypothetical protein
MKAPHSRPHFIDHLQRLGTNDAVKSIRRYGVVTSQIRDNGRLRFACGHVEDIALGDAIGPELSSVLVVTELQDMSLNIRSIAG